jgi:hypothetical protein
MSNNVKTEQLFFKVVTCVGAGVLVGVSVGVGEDVRVGVIVGVGLRVGVIVGVGVGVGVPQLVVATKPNGVIPKMGSICGLNVIVTPAPVPVIKLLQQSV